MGLARYLTADRIIPEIAARDKEGVLAELAAAIVQADSRLDRGRVLSALREREQLGSTGIGDGIAIPHAKMADAVDLVLVFGRSRDGVPFDALDGRSVHLFFTLLAPEASPERHLKMLALISRIMRVPAVRKRIIQAVGADEILTILLEGECRR